MAEAVSTQTVAFADAGGLAEGASVRAAGKISEAIVDRNAALIILSGGSTPRETYRLLAHEIREKEIPVRKLRWFLGDERWVPLTSPQSNEAMARESLLGPIGAPDSTVFSWGAGKGDPVECARRYAERVREAMEGNGPDVVFLGMGADGHTASLFPDGVAHVPNHGSVPVGPDIPGLAAAVASQSAGGWRLTLCPRVLNRGRTVIFLVSGAEKAEALRRVRSGDVAAPAAWIRGKTTVYLVTRDALGPEAVDFGKDIRHA
ncbi:MAG TPA: 6-phosphogluconolactonase [Spirochaetia bacterium]|nr:6-phosphogluconolactonase [Spirochaetia bacterium]